MTAGAPSTLRRVQREIGEGPKWEARAAPVELLQSLRAGLHPPGPLPDHDADVELLERKQKLVIVAPGRAADQGRLPSQRAPPGVARDVLANSLDQSAQNVAAEERLVAVFAAQCEALIEAGREAVCARWHGGRSVEPDRPGRLPDAGLQPRRWVIRSAASRSSRR